MPDTMLVQDAERIERGDVEFLAQTGQRALRHLGGGFLTNPAGQQAWILSGFGLTSVGRVLTVTRGTAILSAKEQNQVVVGMLTTEGPATVNPDLSSYAQGPIFNVYVRFETSDGAFQNRIFWDPVAPGEFSQSVPTRRFAGWGVNVTLQSAGSPGGEWFKIGEVVVGVATLTLTNKRQFYFEGDEANSYITGWGGGNDRNNNRALYGVGDVRTFAAAMNQKMKEVQGHNWWLTPPEPLNQKVSRNGDLVLNGNYRFLGGGNNVRFDTSIDTYQVVYTHGGFNTLAGAEITGGLTMHSDIVSDGVPRNIGDATTGRMGAEYAQALDLKAGAAGTGSIQAAYANSGSFQGLLLGMTAVANRSVLLGDNLLYETGTGKPTAYMGVGSTFTNFWLDFRGVHGLMFEVATGNRMRVMGDAIPDVDVVGDLGYAANRWRQVRGRDAFFNTLTMMNASSNVIGNLVPQGAGQTLGDGGHAWDSLTLGGMASDMQPDVDNTRNLGVSGRRWNKAHVYLLRTGLTIPLSYSFPMSGIDTLFVSQAGLFAGPISGVNDQNDVTNRKIQIACGDATEALLLNTTHNSASFLSFQGTTAAGTTRAVSTGGAFARFQAAVKVIVNGVQMWINCYT